MRTVFGILGSFLFCVTVLISWFIVDFLEKFPYTDRTFSYQSVTLREAAKHFGYSTSHFSTLIKESTGQTFLQIIRDIKLNQACHALRETSLSNLAICELVGYESPEHFMCTFKKTYGMTPGEYRKKNRE